MNTAPADAHVQRLLAGDKDEVRTILRAVLTEYDPNDPEQCPACDAVADHCPYHRGIDDGIGVALRQIGAYATHLGNSGGGDGDGDHDALDEFFAQQIKETTR